MVPWMTPVVACAWPQPSTVHVRNKNENWIVRFTDASILVFEIFPITGDNVVPLRLAGGGHVNSKLTIAGAKFVHPTGYGPSAKLPAWYPLIPTARDKGLRGSAPAFRLSSTCTKSYRGRQPSSFLARSSTHTLSTLGNILRPRRAYSGSYSGTRRLRTKGAFARKSNRSSRVKRVVAVMM